jgi:hypothetical protein
MAIWPPLPEYATNDAQGVPSRPGRAYVHIRPPSSACARLRRARFYNVQVAACRCGRPRTAAVQQVFIHWAHQLERGPSSVAWKMWPDVAGIPARGAGCRRQKPPRHLLAAAGACHRNRALAVSLKPKASAKRIKFSFGLSACMRTKDYETDGPRKTCH